jgi:predicted esterase
MISENLIQTAKTARYYFAGKPGKSITKIWFVFHGYGQLAKDFINNFEEIINPETLIIAPEALNKFYVRGFYGKIGSTWMTKEDRENEIADYIKMISKIYNDLSVKVNLSEVDFNVLGFSQGTHTAVRWLSKTKTVANNLILWGGAFPHDYNYIAESEYWSTVKAKIVIGTKDKFISKTKLNEEIEFINTQKLFAELIKYKGSHEIDKSVLKKIISSL